MINDLSDLKKLFKLCRAQGVDKIKFQGLEIDFGAIQDKHASPAQELMDEELEGDDLAFYSSDQGQTELDKLVGLRK